MLESLKNQRCTAFDSHLFQDLHNEERVSEGMPRSSLVTAYCERKTGEDNEVEFVACLDVEWAKYDVRDTKEKHEKSHIKAVHQSMVV